MLETKDYYQKIHNSQWIHHVRMCLGKCDISSWHRNLRQPPLPSEDIGFQRKIYAKKREKPILSDFWHIFVQIYPGSTVFWSKTWIFGQHFLSRQIFLIL